MTLSDRPLPPLPLKWWEGMLLAPQHMQQLALRQEMLLGYQAGLLAPCASGVVHLQTTADAASGVLADGRIGILSLEALLPDGTLVSHNAGSTPSLSFSVGSALPPTEGGSLRLYLALPRRSAGDAAPGATARFVPLVDRSVPDENTDADSIELTRLAPSLSLSAGAPADDRFIGLPLLTVEFASGAYRLAEYVPPSLLAVPGETLHSLCAGLADDMRQAAAGLTALAGLSTTDWRAGLVQQATAELRALAAGLPGFEALVYGPAVHPHRLYLGLCTLAGSVSAARAGLLPPRFPAYDHLDALPCFRAVSGYVRGVLDGLGGASQMLPFERQDGVFRLKIEAAWLSSALTIGVLPGSAHHYMETCLIGGAAAMPGLRRRRVPGAGRHRLPEQEALALARRPDMAVYRLSDCPVSAGEMLEIGLFQAGETLEPPDAIVFFLPQGAGTG